LTAEKADEKMHDMCHQDLGIKISSDDDTSFGMKKGVSYVLVLAPGRIGWSLL
jgi:hypothetical protein